MRFSQQMKFVVLDVETTGLSPMGGDRIIEIAALKALDFQEEERFQSLVDPQRSLSYGAYLVNRISAEMLVGAPKAEDVLPDLFAFLGDAAWVGHHVRFDVRFLLHEFHLIGKPWSQELILLDTSRIARILLPDLGRYSLGHVAQTLGIEIFQQHRAMADVELTFGVLQALYKISQRKGLTDFAEFFDRFSQRHRLPIHFSKI